MGRPRDPPTPFPSGDDAPQRTYLRRDFAQCGLAVGRMMISLTSTAFGCAIAQAMASPTALAGMATLRKSRIAAAEPSWLIVLASSDSVTPGLMVVARTLVVS